MGLASIVMASVVIYVLSGQIIKISSAITQNRTAITILESRGLVTEELKNNFSAIGDGDKKIEEAFIEAKDIVRFINELESLADKNKLEQDIRFSTPTPLVGSEAQDESTKALNLTRVDYSIDLQGSVASIGKYLEELESIPYFSSVKSITLVSLSTTTNWKNQASVSIEAQLYLRK